MREKLRLFNIYFKSLIIKIVLILLVLFDYFLFIFEFNGLVINIVFSRENWV